MRFRLVWTWALLLPLALAGCSDVARSNKSSLGLTIELARGSPDGSAIQQELHLVAMNALSQDDPQFAGEDWEAGLDILSLEVPIHGVSLRGLGGGVSPTYALVYGCVKNGLEVDTFS